MNVDQGLPSKSIRMLGKETVNYLFVVVRTELDIAKHFNGRKFGTKNEYI